jgi:hypothetical protein
MSGCRFCRGRAVIHFDRRIFCSNALVEKYRATLRCDEAMRSGPGLPTAIAANVYRAPIALKRAA